MKNNSDAGRRPADYCDRLGEGDGIDPREESNRGGRRRGPDRKTLQLCAAVGRTLHQLLSGECGDDLLAGCRVLSVVPAPNAGRLLVTVVSDGPPDVVASRLAAASGFLRSQVAASIHRKKTPELTFAVSPEAADG